MTTGSWLSERQRRTVAAALTTLSAAVIVCAIGALLWLFGSFAVRFSNVFLPLAVAAVLALVVEPYYRWLIERARLPTAAAIVLVLFSLLLPFGAFAWIFGALVLSQLSDLVTHLPELWDRLRAEVAEAMPRVEAFIERHRLDERARAALASRGAGLAAGLGSIGGAALTAGANVVRWLFGLLGWVVLPVYFVFILLLMSERRRFDDVGEWLPFLKPETRADAAYLAREFVTILVAFFRGQLIVAVLMGLLFAIGFQLVGLSYGFVLGLLLGLLNVIPYLGSLVGLGLALPLALFQDGGGLALAGLVLVVFCVVQAIEGYVLTPKVMGQRTGLHPMVIIVAVFFWGSALGGIAGMILAIPLTAFLVVFWRLARTKYIGELV